MQRVFAGYDELSEYLAGKNILFVHGKSFAKFTHLNEFLRSVHAEFCHFTAFSPNPKIEEARNAAEIFRSSKCSIILAIGGGSAMDTAKFVKLQNPEARLAVIPTTAGSGSEATRFAVLYEDGKKLSITDNNIIPDYVLFDSELLKYLPDYHRKSSALDALSHALESFWSVNANEESRQFSREALSNITRLLENYPDSYSPEDMLRSAYTAGKAINISQTTAGHAMCYRITGIFGTAHGHSAAMCNRVLFWWLTGNTKLPVLKDIAEAMGCDSPEGAAAKFEDIFSRLGLEIPEASAQQIESLTDSVNPERLKNFPAKLDTQTIKELYTQILNVKE